MKGLSLPYGNQCDPKESNDDNIFDDSGIVPEVSRFKVCYWNGGGGLLKRLKVNPALRKLLDKRPDIFVYGKSGMSTKGGLFLKDYIFIFHRNKQIPFFR